MDSRQQVIANAPDHLAYRAVKCLRHSQFPEAVLFVIDSRRLVKFDTLGVAAT
jgi:hypothetical protein